MNRRTDPPSRPKQGGCSLTKQAGFSLIEVLVAMLVVAVGIVALAGSLAAAARFGKTGEYRAVAVLLAGDIADRMRANRAGAVDGRYNLTRPYDVQRSPPPTQNCADNNACTVPELAALDLSQWQRSLYRALPNGLGYLRFDPNTLDSAPAADIWVTWLDPAAAADEPVAANECPPAFRGVEPQPRCLYVRAGL